MSIQTIYPAAAAPRFALGQRVEADTYPGSKPLFVLALRYQYLFIEEDGPGEVRPGEWEYLIGRVQTGRYGTLDWWEWGWLPEHRVAVPADAEPEEQN